jgi:transcriptional regulator with XRE-family HTH domain
MSKPLIPYAGSGKYYDPSPKAPASKPAPKALVPTEWGKLVRDIRAERCLSQRQLADGAKVNRSTLRRIEEGTFNHHGNMETMERLFHFMGYEMDVFPSQSLSEYFSKRLSAASDPDQRSKMSARALLRLTPR